MTGKNLSGQRRSSFFFVRAIKLVAILWISNRQTLGKDCILRRKRPL